MTKNFLRKEDGRNVFEFECERCEAIGEIGIPERSTKLVVHECGEIFVHRPTTGKQLFGKPTLETLD